MRFGRCEHERRGFWSGDEVLPLHAEWCGSCGGQLCRRAHQLGELSRADLRGAKNLVDVKRANFQRADLRGADLSKMKQPMVGLEWDDAIYDAKTKFPAGFDPVKAGAKAAQ